MTFDGSLGLFQRAKSVSRGGFETFPVGRDGDVRPVGGHVAAMLDAIVTKPASQLVFLLPYGRGAKYIELTHFRAPSSFSLKYPFWA